jgi:transcriptional regulator with GAF, ATPase, and Fis domain
MNDKLGKQISNTPEKQFFDLTNNLILKFSGLPEEETDQMILSSLDEVGRFFDVEEVFIVRLDQTAQTWTFLFNSKLQKEGELLHEYPLGTLPWIEEQVQARQEVILSDINQMPAEASIDQALLKKYKLQSIIIEPIKGLQESVKGCVGLSSYHGLREWSIVDAQQLKMIGSVLINAFERRILLHDREEKKRFFSLVNHFTQIALEATDFTNAINLMLKKLYEISGADFCGIGLWDADNARVYPAAAFGIEDDDFLAKSFDYSDRIVTAEILESGQPLVIEDISSTKYRDYKIFKDFPVSSVIVLPLMTKEIKLGSVFIAYTLPHKFNEDRVAYYCQVSEQLTLAMNKIKLWESSQRHYEEMHTLTQISSALRNAQSLSEIPAAVAQTVMDLCNVRNLAIAFTDSSHNSKSHYFSGEDWQHLAPGEFDREYRFINEAINTGKTVYGRTQIASMKTDTSEEESFDIIVYPLKAHNQMLGCLCVQSPNILEKSKENIFSAVADLIANAAFRQTLMDNLHFQLETLRTTKMQLFQSEKLAAIGELVASVAHELNNPLTTITLLSELLQRQSDRAQERYDLGKILSESRRAASIIRSLLDFSRQRVSEQQAVNLNVILQSSIELISYELNRNDIAYTLELDPKFPLRWQIPIRSNRYFLIC